MPSSFQIHVVVVEVTPFVNLSALSFNMSLAIGFTFVIDPWTFKVRLSFTLALAFAFVSAFAFVVLLSSSLGFAFLVGGATAGVILVAGLAAIGATPSRGFSFAFVLTLSLSFKL